MKIELWSVVALASFASATPVRTNAMAEGLRACADMADLAAADAPSTSRAKSRNIPYEDTVRAQSILRGVADRCRQMHRAVLVRCSL